MGCRMSDVDFGELRQAVLATLELAQARVAEVTQRYEQLLEAERTQHRIALSEAVTRLTAERDEARRHVDYLTVELVARAQHPPSSALAGLGQEVCRKCRAVFDKKTSRQRVCGACKAAQGRVNAAHFQRRRARAAGERISRSAAVLAAQD